MLVNSLGPIELWAFSTTPRTWRCAIGSMSWSGSRRGCAVCRVCFDWHRQEGGRPRKDERLRRGEEDGRAQAGVVDELADELINGRGLGIVLRKHEADERVREAVD